MSNSKEFIPFRSGLKEKAQDNRKNLNKPEAKLWYEVLRNKQMLDYRFLRQKPVLNYILDFYCHKLKLGIEVDGDIHAEQEPIDMSVQDIEALASQEITSLKPSVPEKFDEAADENAGIDAQKEMDAWAALKRPQLDADGEEHGPGTPDLTPPSKW